MRSRWIKYDSLPSTNTELSRLQKDENPEEGTVIIADYQESGRGLGDHAWESGRGKNLLMSLLLHPAFLSASEQFHLSRVASLALCDVLSGLGADPVIKWPNDILTSGGKIAGILIEHGITGGNLSHTIIGIGVNLNQAIFPPFPMPASSLYMETGKTHEVYEVAEAVEQSTMSRYVDLMHGRREGLEEEYLEKLLHAGRTSEFRAGDESFEGIIRGVTGFGELKVEHEGVIRIFGHGSISLAHVPGKS